MPGAFTFAVDLPSWWLGIFYAGAIIYFTIDVVRRHGRWQIMACLAWLILGCVLALSHGGPSAFRCTFLAIGHGGCTVLELPNGRVILYDAGAITGPDVTRRVIAPFLWNRGFRRIDEVIISHGDLDHFNGLPPLMDRFAIGQVTLTPTFADHTTPGVAFATRALEKKGLTTRIAHAPMRWNVGDVQFEALHPPARGPEGKENARSLVLAVRHQGVTLLLTGDLEDAGLERVLKLRTFPVDVLMAPHHGSTRANTKELATWARPQFVVSCQGPPKSVPKEPNPYEALGARWLSTWSQGAVTIRHDDDTWIVETHVTKNRWAIQR